MLDNKSSKIYSKYILFFFTLIFFINYLIIHFNVNQYNWIASIDHDEGFLIEQLILKLNFFEITRSVSRLNEYGVEFYYLSKLINFINLFISLNKINIYHISIFLHLIFNISSFFLIFRIFQKLKINYIYYFLFSFTILS